MKPRTPTSPSVIRSDKKLVCPSCKKMYDRIVASRMPGYFQPLRTFKTEQALLSHLRVHDEMYCPLCSKFQGVPDYACNSHFA